MEAVDQLYLQCDALQAARNLAALAAGATLGELGSLEEVVQQLLHRQLLQSIVLKVGSRRGFNGLGLCPGFGSSFTKAQRERLPWDEGHNQSVTFVSLIFSLSPAMEPHLIYQQVTSLPLCCLG